MHTRSRIPRLALNLFLVGVISLSFSMAARNMVLAQNRTAEEDIDTFTPLVEVIAEVMSTHVVGNGGMDEAEVIEQGIHGMVGELDLHSQYMPSRLYKEFQDGTRGTFGGLGIRIQKIRDWLAVVEPLPGTPAAAKGLRPGDRIVRIEGRTTKRMPINDAVTRLKGAPGTEVNISVLREGWEEPREMTLVRDIIQVPSVEALWIDERFGYIRLREFQQNSSKDMERILNELNKKGMEGLVLDLRFNQGGLLNVAREVCDMLLPRNVAVVKIKEGNKEEMNVLRSHLPPLVDVPLVVLVNGGSASASEIVAGAVQDWRRGVIVGPAGERTYGKGSVQTVIDLHDGSGLKMTTAKYFTPKERSIHRKDPMDPKTGGIEPDVTIDLPREVRRDLNFFKMGELPPNHTVEKVRDPMVEPLPEYTPPEGEDDPAPGVYDFDLERAVQILEAGTIFDKTAAAY